MTVQAFTGGSIVTMDPALETAEVLIVDRGRIEAVGSREILGSYPDAELHALEGRTLLPGFIDAHNHFSIAALHPLWADLSGVRNLEELQGALAAQGKQEPEAPWVRGVRWDALSSGFELTRRELDQVDSERPVIVVHYSYHECVVNSAGLEVLGIGRATRDPAGGEVVRGADGEPTGVLVERAWADAQTSSLAVYADPDRWGDCMERHARFLLSHGITCVHEAACSPAADAVYRRLASSGRLPISVLAMVHPGTWFADPPPEQFEGPPTGEGDENYRIGPMKFFADGGSHPALDITIGGQRVTLGHLFPALVEPVARAVERGFSVAVHAMGNLGVESALEAFEHASRLRVDSDQRFRLEHLTLATPEQIERLAALGVIAVIQPGFVELFGKFRERGGLPPLDNIEPLAFRDLREAGMPLAASSDDPCGPFVPLETSRLGATRRTLSGVSLGPEQALDYGEWLRAYTLGAANAGGQEQERGSLLPGKRADLVVVEGELSVDGNPRVVQTWVGGELAYAAEAE
jgi:predicted amidohydrolase YtcJ